MFCIIKMLPFHTAPYTLAFLVLALMLASSAQAQEPTDLPLPTGLPNFDVDFESVNTTLTYCPPSQISFELITGFVYSAPADMLDTQPGTLMLTDCIDMCRKNKSCLSANYETGLCVLFSSNADMHPGALTDSQFPVFTLYVQKNCFKSQESCNRAWDFERVVGYELEGYTKKTLLVSSRIECEEICLIESEFPCRSANFNNVTGECRISDMDRHTSVGTGAFKAGDNTEYLESNCVDDPVRLCEFQKMDGRILKTVDSVLQEVETLDDCKKMCLSSPYRCHSFDYGDTGKDVCRLSHHHAASLSHITQPYLDIPGASTYELSSCYNVTINCRSGDMVAKIKTSKIFNGKIYAKGSPSTCVNDIDDSLEFEITMAYNDVDCNVKRESPSRYSNDVVIQHHDMIVTSADLGLSVHCKYDLSNKSVSNMVDLQVKGDIKSIHEEEGVVDSPNVIMRVTDSNNEDLISASVGEMLMLVFEIVDRNSPYEIFVRDLVAMDGGDQNVITLLDNRGCPTEVSIMRPLIKIDETGKVLGASFDAFKFPTSEIVQFRALVTPCLPTCEPVICDVMDFGGQVQQKESFGRKRRSVETFEVKFNDSYYYSMVQEIKGLGPNHLDIFVQPKLNTEVLHRPKREATKIPEELLVVQTIKISDKFGFRGNTKTKGISKTGSSATKESKEKVSESEGVTSEEVSGVCINTVGLILACSIFLVAQLVIIVVWTAVWHRRRHNKLEEPLSHATTTESLRQLYDSGYARRI
ncbi:uncharacterized protein LOC143018026 [Oratosquilla oratoria]|uniref:uncharacterized protein LOC143018026 n=1 Tax=Oratosquilla oratoria TaxID=337810 RepID=UPI003F773E85